MVSADCPVTKGDMPLTCTTTPPPNADCDVCSKILEIFQIPYDQEHHVDLGKITDLLAYNCPHSEWLEDLILMCDPDDPLYKKGDLSADKEYHTRVLEMHLHYVLDSWSSASRSFDLELIHRPEVPDHHGTIRLMDNDWVRLDHIKGWISRCTKLHKDKCNKTVGNVEPIRPQILINAVQGCIVDCKEESLRFISLSYTWGKSKNFRLVKSNIEHLQKRGAFQSDHIIAQLPRTILDAIELTKALGETWLWVDSLCVVQDDEESLTYQLSTMHRIYATSFLTIIAADGIDAEYGLRGLMGISLPRDINQNVFPLPRAESMAWIGPSHPPQEPFESNYYERMWTAQEYDFSKRRLVFEDGQVKWECNCAAWTENHLYDQEADKFQLKMGGDYVGQGKHSRIPSLNKLKTITKYFTSKSSRYDEDVFNAFSGYTTYLNSIFPAGLVYGHPQIFFDIPLCWYSYNDLRRRKVSEHYTGDPIHNGLPSWSWMGWQGIIDFPCDAESGDGYSFDLYEMGFTEPATEWYVMPNPGSIQKRKIESRWSQYRTAPHDSMADIWRCTEINPPFKATRHWSESSDNPSRMPKELPRYIYTDISDDFHFPIQRWYPVPVNDTNSNKLPADSFKGYQYLWCQTSHAFLTASPVTIVPESGRRYVHLLKDDYGTTVGALELHNEDGHKGLLQERKVELIAICKGWTNILRRHNVWDTYNDEPSTDTHFSQEDEKREVESDAESWRTMSDMIPWTEKWDIAKKDKQDCYHVLWIEWENGVTYRKAYGFVLEDEWNRLAEPGKIDATIG